MMDFLKEMLKGLVGGVISLIVIFCLFEPRLILFLAKIAIVIAVLILAVKIIVNINDHKKKKRREKEYQEYLANRSDTDRIVDAINDLKWRIR